MAARRQSPSEEPKSRRPPALTPAAREAQLISLAVDLVEKKLRDGTATSQETTHFLKLGSSREQLEQERLQHENALTQARIERLQSEERMEALFANAIESMKVYKGERRPDDEG